MLPLRLIRNPENPLLVELLDRLQRYDVSEVNAIGALRHGWSVDQMRRMELQTKQFLSLVILDYKHAHIPTRSIDDYWHRMILQTKWYEKFCQEVFGFFVHHNPSANPQPDNPAGPRTEQAMTHWYGGEWKGFSGLCCGPVEWQPDATHPLDRFIRSLLPAERTLL